MAIKNNYISPVNGELSVTPVENPVCVYTSYLGDSDVISSDEMNSYKTAKLVNPLGDRISLSLPDDSRQTAPDSMFPLYDDTRTYGFNSATLMVADPADELSFLSYALTVKDRNGVRAFTDIDFKRCLLSGSISYDEVDGKKRYSVGETFTLKYAFGEKTSFLDTNGSISDVEPVVLFTKDNGYYGLELRSMRVSCHYTELTFDKTSNLGPDTTDFGYGTFVERLKRRAIWKAYERGMYPYDGYTEHQTVENMTYSIYHGGSSSGNNTNVVGYLNNEHDALLLIAGAGLAFEVDGVIYKPIVQGGVVVDFTSDMNEKSEWDKWTDFGSRTLPDAPGGGGGGGGEDELPPLAPRDGSIVRGGSWLYLRESDLYNFRNISRVDPNWWDTLSLAQKALLGTKIADTVANYGKDAPVTLLAYSYDIHSVHGLSAGASQTIACPVDLWGGDILDPVGVTAYVPTGATGASFGVGSRRVNAGSITVTPRDPAAGVTFLDFEPYTTLHAYIPFVGWTSISCSQCMNKAVSLQYFVDIYSGTGVAYILSGSTVIQQYECSLAAEEALEVNQYSVHTSAMRDFTVPATAALTGAITGNPMATAIGVAGVAGAVGASVGNAMSAYSNPSTVMAGSHNTDASIDSCPNQFTIVAYRPDIELPADYARKVGHACDKTGPLSSFSGFTVVENPDTSGAVCTDDERRELEAILRGGIII